MTRKYLVRFIECNHNYYYLIIFIKYNHKCNYYSSKTLDNKRNSFNQTKILLYIIGVSFNRRNISTKFDQLATD